MKILFTGNHINNNGPENVNKGLINEFTEEFTYLKSKNNVALLLELIYKCLKADVIVASGTFRPGEIAFKIAKRLKKPCVFIMHGCAEYETKVNNNPCCNGVAIEEYLMENADLILAVSERFMKWLQNRFPQYALKINYLNNGVIKPDFGFLNFEKVSGSIIAVGGDRFTKNNKVTSQAVEMMDGKAHLQIYGKIYSHIPTKNGKFTEYMGLVSMEELYKQMAKSELFVLNSIFEPFSLSVIDAINCKCSVLLSDAVGINGILELEECDVIRNPNDTDEIKRKIEYLLEHPNCERIANALDYDAHSFKNSVMRLKSLCSDLIKQ